MIPSDAGQSHRKLLYLTVLMLILLLLPPLMMMTKLLYMTSLVIRPGSITWETLTFGADVDAAAAANDDGNAV